MLAVRLRLAYLVCAALCGTTLVGVFSETRLCAQSMSRGFPSLGQPGGDRSSSTSRFESGPSIIPAATEGPRQLVVGVRVVGNSTAPETKVMSYIKTRRDRVFDRELVEADVRRLVASGLFQNVRTYTEPTEGGVVVTFELFERPTIRYVKYVGNRGIRDKVLAKETGLKVGDALNIYSVEEARRKVEEFYHGKGFPQTRVTVFEGTEPRDRGVVFIIHEGELERIATVRFVGNDPNVATDARLKTQIQSKPGYFWYLFRGKVDRKKIDEDVDRLTAYYRSLGYFRARVGREMEYDESGKWLTLSFVIDEGPRYAIRNVSIAGNKKFNTQALIGQLELQSGEFFNLAKMNRDVNGLRDLYGSQGHIFADIKADPRFLEEPGQLDLVYDIKEGDLFRVGEIRVHIDGDYPHTRIPTVLNRLSFRPGDIIDIREVRASERRLKSSQLFENNPAQGIAPRVVIRPPDLDAAGSLAGAGGPSSGGPSSGGPSSGGTAFRGQSPDPPRSRAWSHDWRSHAQQMGPPPTSIPPAGSYGAARSSYYARPGISH